MSPFKNHRHAETIELGDPILRPELAEVFEVAFSKTWSKVELSAIAYFNYTKDKVFRVIADHLRASTFIIGDEKGVTPGLGVVEVPSGSELDFIRPMHVKSLWGVGPATLEKLERIGISKVSDLAVAEVSALKHSIGEAHALHLVQLANGIDRSPVVSDRETKSIGHEETFSHDLFDKSVLRTHLVRLADAVARRC
jgi:hypothetical protein